MLHREPSQCSSRPAVVPERDCVPPVAQHALADAQLTLLSWLPWRVGEGTGYHAPPVQCSMTARPPAELPPTAQQSAAPGQVMDSSAAPLAARPAGRTLLQLPLLSCRSSGPRASDSVLPPGALPVWPTAQHCAGLGQATAVR